MPELTKGEQEKIRLEHEAAKLFMRAYEKETGCKIRHIWHNKPRKPDTSCMLGDEHLDMEIAHLYGSEIEAMKLLGRELPDKSKLDLHLLERSSKTEERLLIALNLILENKAKKQYQSDRVWLVIRNAHPEWSAQSIEKMKSKIIIPKHHSFNQIWVVGDMKGLSGIVCLYDRNTLQA